MKRLPTTKTTFAYWKVEKLFYFLNLFSIRSKSFSCSISFAFLPLLCSGYDSVFARTLRTAENPESFSSHSFFIFSHCHPFGWYEKWNIKRCISKSISIVVRPYPFQFYAFFSSTTCTIFFFSLIFSSIRFVHASSRLVQCFFSGKIFLLVSGPKVFSLSLSLSLSLSSSICFY